MTVECDHKLRELINGGRLEQPAPQRLERLDDPETVAVKRRTHMGFVLGGIGGLCAGAAFAALVALNGSEPEREIEVMVAPVQVENPHTARISDGGPVPRHTPTGLNGRVIEALTPIEEPAEDAVARASPAPLKDPVIESGELDVPTLISPELRQADGAAVAEASEGPGAAQVAGDQGPEEGQPVAPAAVPQPELQAPALVVASANLVMSRLFNGVGGIAYAPLRFVDATLWEDGACGHRSRPAFPAYCTLDRSLYGDPATGIDAHALYAFAHEFGHHVQNVLGVALSPIDVPANDLQADCFAGVWAHQDPLIHDILVVDGVAEALAARETRQQRAELRRLAFETGRAAGGLMACDAIDGARLTSPKGEKTKAG
ncbi:MAG: neutral zinc metallopeptidase [Pikeienuella sp.]